MSWRNDAACRGMGVNLFFPATTDWHAYEPAKAVCATCPVSDECVMENIHEQHGVFGGTSPTQRRQLRERLGVRKPLPDLHGTESAYARLRCRCQDCADARRLAEELRREREARSACA